jgi:phosphate-selective porin
MKRRILYTMICLSVSGIANADEAAMQQRIDTLSNQLETLKQQMATMDERTEAIADQQEMEQSGMDNNAVSSGKDVSIWGYGEINYNRPVDDTSKTKMDLRRAVLGVGYSFDDDTRFNSEFEFEHAVTSADDEGEVGVEQFNIEHDITENTSMKAGLFFIPMGLLNESHEPTRYYGVERNFVETAIIPTTWREGGVGLYGGNSLGIAWDAGITTGFDLGKWDPASTEGQESPLGSIHQELSNANARDLSVYLALNYRGIPGWVAGASIFTGKASQGNPAASLASDSKVTLWDVHTRWTPGNFDLSALYAHGGITDTAALNATFAGNPTLIPEEFWGAYAQAAYKFALGSKRSIAPFVRYEKVNTGSSYAALPAGLNVSNMPTETVWTAGISYYLNPNVVFKADYQGFDVNSNSDRYNLGMGVEF